jgi:exodeoxyribonuclease-3
MRFVNLATRLLLFACLMIVPAGFPHSSYSEESPFKTLKILCLNTAGIHPGEKRYQRLIEFVRVEDPDILGLLELNDWNKDDFAILKDFLSHTKFQNHIFGQANSDFHLAIFSKHPLLKKESLPEKIGHGLAHVEIEFEKGILSVFLTHLTPGTEDARVREMNQILSYVQPNSPTVIMGDLNSLSPNDPYQDAELLEVFRKSEIKKFGVDTVRKDLISKLQNAGFKDSSVLTDSPFEPTVPTRFNSDPAHATELRLDYIFLSNNLKNHLAKYDVVKNSETDQISDHYPVLVELRAHEA